MVDAAGNPTGRWAKYGGWNLELLASMRPEVAGGILRRMSLIGDKAIPAHMMEEAKEEIRQIRIAAPPGVYRANGRK
jgi:ferredoxin-thioredoxin reductase catalytic subunit